MYSQPVNMGFLSRREINRSWHDVYLHGGHAVGIDRRTHRQTFGDGPGSRKYVQNLNELLRRRHAYEFADPRDVWTTNIFGKRRQISITPFPDRVLHRALTGRIRRALPPSQINVCRPGLDTRFSVVRLAVAMRSGCRGVLRTDLKQAFDSITWPQVLTSPQADALRVSELDALEQILGFYGPWGRGIPTGVAFSPVLLDLACLELDRRLQGTGLLALRYMDDIAVVVTDRQRAGELVQMINSVLATYDLECNSDKTNHDLDQVQWLGHQICNGRIDVAREPAEELLRRPSSERLTAWLHQFRLAAQGNRYRCVLETLKGAEPALMGKMNSSSTTNPAASPWQELLDGDHPHVALLEQGTCLPPQQVGIRTRAGLMLDGDRRRPGGHRAEAGGDCPRRWSCHVRLHRRGANRTPGPEGFSLQPCKRNRHRTWLPLIEVAGGRRGLLRLAYDWCNSPGQGDDQAEARILFNGASEEKALQLGRCFEYWQQVMAILERAGRQLSPRQEEQLLQKVWPVLMAAGTVIFAEAHRYCREDPLEWICRRIGGAPVTQAKRSIVRERMARSRGEVPRHQSLFSRVVLGNADDPIIQRLVDRQRNRHRDIARVFGKGRQSNKRRGMEREQTVATALGGTTTPASGALKEKGDVVAPSEKGAIRCEVKLGYQRWRVPLFQLKQLKDAVARGEDAAVVLTTATTIPLVMVPIESLEQPPQPVLERRVIEHDARWLSLGRSKYVGMLEAGGVALLETRSLGTWALLSFAG